LDSVQEEHALAADSMHSRRDFQKLVAGGLCVLAARHPGWAAPVDTVRGVRLGITTASLNPLPAQPDRTSLDVLIEECLELGVHTVELAGGFFGPAVLGAVGGQTPKRMSADYQRTREAQRAWRLSPSSMEEVQRVRDSFRNAGVEIFSISNTFADDVTDAEMDAMFRQMRELGVTIFQTNQTRVSMGPRLVPFADKYGIYPSFHTHAESNDPNEIASVESLAKLLAMSPQFRVCLDIGHFTAGNNDAVAHLRERHQDITHIHVKDRKKNKGPNVEWGTGDTPIRECLMLIRDENYLIPCIIEREFKGSGTPLEETRKDLDFMKRILTA
jgi:sugar phosphate isomerase/epimerase